MRFSLSGTGLMIAAAAMMSVSSNTASATALKDVQAAAEGGRQMTSRELYKLYKGHSWIWKDGVAYFRVSRREFIGWSKPPGPDANYADGRWFLPGQGKLCFRATWHSVQWSAKALRCFEHRIDDRGAIFIRKYREGEWWTFDDVPQNSWDEKYKVKPGNYAAAGYKRNKAYVEKNRPPDPCLEAGQSKIFCKLFGP